MNRAELVEIYREPRVAFIEEDLCIGCTKCITACPFDTIVGAAKLMHTVIESECTGCGLCVPACPMDCIVMLPTQRVPEAENTIIDNWLQRQENHEQRLARDAQEKTVQEQHAKMAAKKQAIAEAIARVKAKRNSV